MNFFKQIITSALCALLIITACASCGGTKDTGGVSSTTKSSSAASSKPTRSEPAQSQAAVTSGNENQNVATLKFREASANKQVKNLKILPVGDSLTYGIGTLSGWRFAAFRELYAAGVTFEFVGPYTSEWDYRLISRYNKHGGESGRTISQVLDKADEIFNREFDVVMLMIGYNDKVAIDSRHDVYKSLVNKIFSYNPNATVFCMGIAPDYNGGKEFKDFNIFIEDMCNQMHDGGKEIYFISTQSSKWDKDTCFTDYVHFNEKGNAIIAECVAKAAADKLLKLNTPDSSYMLPISPTGISLDKSSLSIKKYSGHSEAIQLNATVTPSNAEVKDVVWASSDEKVATVDVNGVVTAVGAGTCTITAATLDGGHRKTCSVTVTKDDAPCTVLLNDGLSSAAAWDGKTSNVIFGMYSQQQNSASTKPVLTSKAEFNPGNKFYLTFELNIHEVLVMIRTTRPSNYVNLKLGSFNLRIYDNARSAAILCNGEKICTYNRGTYTTDMVEYGLLYDNGKVTLTVDGVAVSTANATPESVKSMLSLTNYESSTSGKTIHVDSIKLVKY